MKRISIIAIASIFLVNMLALIPHAATIYENGTLAKNEVTLTATGETSVMISGDYILNKNETYTITIKAPVVNNVIPEKFGIKTSIASSSIDIENNQIVNTTSNVVNAEYKNGVITFELKNINADGNDPWRQLGYRLYGTKDQKLTVTVENPILIIEKIVDPGKQLIQNVEAAPKDVLREVVAILPVLIAILIAYIATRKGIAFIRSILESA